MSTLRSSRPAWTGALKAATEDGQCTETAPKKTTRHMKRLSIGLFVLLALASRAATVEVQVDKPGYRIPPTLWGIFFEDINLSADVSTPNWSETDRLWTGSNL